MTFGFTFGSSSTPQWFFIMAIVLAIIFVLYSEWNSRK